MAAPVKYGLVINLKTREGAWPRGAVEAACTRRRSNWI